MQTTTTVPITDNEIYSDELVVHFIDVDQGDSMFIELPNGETMSMKLCQENCKALMSNPNKALGKWLLRDVLKVPYGQIITYQDLLEIGIDSVSFKKIEDKKYMLDFKNVGEFENFINKEYMSDIDN